MGERKSAAATWEPVSTHGRPRSVRGRHLRGTTGFLAGLPHLVSRGQFFGLETGERFTAIQSSDYNLLARFQRGENIIPVLEQRQTCGFNLRRVWTLFDIPGIGTLTTCDYEQIPAFVKLCAKYGQYVEFTAYTGINDPDHWTQLCDAALDCSPRPLLEYVNEQSENTNEADPLGRVMLYTRDPKKLNDRIWIRVPDKSDPRKFTDYEHAKAPAPLLSAHGSNGSQQWPVMPHWSYATFHTNASPEEQRKVGHNAWEIWRGPTLTNETSRFPDVGMWRSPQARRLNLALDSAAGAALLCAGSCFHSVHGKTGQLLEGEELDAAQAWANGARSVDLAAQDSPYEHPINLETIGVLRAYRRRPEVVLIRK